MKQRFWPTSTSMAYPMMAKFMGTYEREIHPFIEDICARRPDTIVDVGSADGFYLVGFALRLPRSRIVGFESSSMSAHAMKLNYTLNHRPGRIDPRGRCDPPALRQSLAGTRNPVVFCDVDGYEDVLIDPDAVPELRACVILVEVHDRLVPGVAHRLRHRFAPTHSIRIVEEQPRTPADRPPGCPLGDEDFLEAAEEFRSGNPGLWYYMTPRDETHPSKNEGVSTPSSPILPNG